MIRDVAAGCIHQGGNGLLEHAGIEVAGRTGAWHPLLRDDPVDHGVERLDVGNALRLDAPPAGKLLGNGFRPGIDPRRELAHFGDRAQIVSRRSTGREHLDELLGHLLLQLLLSLAGRLLIDVDRG